MRHARPDYERFQDPAGLIPEDEPVFLIRGQDINAPQTLRYWAECNDANGGDKDISELARRHANAMLSWQARATFKIPDLPATEG